MFSAISSLLHIPYNWLTKLMYLGLMIALWNISLAAFGFKQTDLIENQNYVFNLTVYKIFPESSIIAVEQVIVLLITINLTVWIFRSEHAGLPHRSV